MIQVLCKSKKVAIAQNRTTYIEPLAKKTNGSIHVLFLRSCRSVPNLRALMVRCIRSLTLHSFPFNGLPTQSPLFQNCSRFWKTASIMTSGPCKIFHTASLYVTIIHFIVTRKPLTPCPIKVLW